ncbi:MAG: NAD-binding protein [Gemmatimonadota bacterium]|nr:NAD-binding protein [Gemmatimonadota bacterium]
MPSRTRQPRFPTGLAWRLSLAVLVTVLAILAFRMGVEGSDRPGIPTAGLATQLYYAIGLFVLGGLDLGVPVGGPVVGRDIMWTAYFAAPLLTAGALIEGLLHVWNPRWWRLKGLRDHIVIAGMGEIGRLYLEALRDVDPRRRVLVVDVLSDHVNVIGAVNRHEALFLSGDIRNQSTIDALRLQRARGVVLTTGSDLVNLEAATDILGGHPRLADRIVAHVSDGALERSVVGGGQEPGGNGATLSGRRLFNAHRIAADELVHRRLVPRFEETRLADVVVLAGFGRFGQTILEMLMTEAADEFSTVLILDRVAEMRRRQFDEHAGRAATHRLLTLERDLQDPGTWVEVENIIEGLGADPGDGGRPDPDRRSAIFVMGTDDDPLNLRSAMTVRRRSPGAHIVVRCFHDSSLTDHLAEQGRFDVFGVSTLLRDALAEHHRQWFLKRHGGA